MSPTLRSLLLAVGTVIATGATIYTFSGGTTVTDARDAGMFNTCTPRIAVTREVVAPRLRQRLLDDGAALRPRQSHVRLLRQAYRCPEGDGGTALVLPGWRAMQRREAARDDAEDVLPVLNEVVRDVPCASEPGFCDVSPLHVRHAPGEVPPCVRARPDAGLRCLRREALPAIAGGDGGFRVVDMGRTVTPRALAIDAGACELVECSVVAGEDPEEAL